MTAATKRRLAHVQKKYAWLHADLKAKRGVSYAHGNSTVPGCRVIEATFIENPGPVGVIWYRHGHSKGVIEILGMFVIDYYRRCGLASYLLEKLVAAFPATVSVVSGDGTEYGSAWMRANGFVRTSAGEWIKTIPPAPKKGKARRCKR